MDYDLYDVSFITERRVIVKIPKKLKKKKDIEIFLCDKIFTDNLNLILHRDYDFKIKEFDFCKAKE